MVRGSFYALFALALTGDPQAIAKKVGLSVADGYAEFSVSGNGTLAFGAERGGSESKFAWRDRSGKLAAMIGPRVFTAGFRLSSDAGRVAYKSLGGHWVLDLTRGTSAVRWK